VCQGGGKGCERVVNEVSLYNGVCEGLGMMYEVNLSMCGVEKDCSDIWTTNEDKRKGCRGRKPNVVLCSENGSEKSGPAHLVPI